MFIVWLALVAWFIPAHTFWRDEVRAFSIALSGSNVVEMLRTLHGEGHPALWYLILRGAHGIFPVREVLPAAAAVIGVAAMWIVAWFSPFRTVVLALIMFSFWGAFEYVVVARNYGISELVMFALAALYPRVRNSLWFGFILMVLCNTNVIACLLAAMFLLFRLIEMVTDAQKPAKREWLIFAGNAALALVGALLCFATVYPTYNDAAISSNSSSIGPAAIIAGLIDARVGFSHLNFGPALLFAACLGLIRRPAPFVAAIAGLIVLKLFFYFVYQSYYRHEALYVVFLITLFWMSAEGGGGSWRVPRWMDAVQHAGALVFVALLAMQTLHLVYAVRMQIAGLPYSRSKDTAKLLQRPGLRGAIVMADPDTMLEPLPYYVDNPLYFMRQQRFGKFVRLSNDARKQLTLDDILADADRLHRETGRPVVFLDHMKLQPDTNVRRKAMYDYYTTVTPAGAKHFLSSTRLIAKLRPSDTDENYDVYVYPR